MDERSNEVECNPTGNDVIIVTWGQIKEQLKIFQCHVPGRNPTFSIMAARLSNHCSTRSPSELVCSGSFSVVPAIISKQPSVHLFTHWFIHLRSILPSHVD